VQLPNIVFVKTLYVCILAEAENV